MATRKDYEAVAGIIHDQAELLAGLYYDTHSDTARALSQMVWEFGNIFGADNPRFDRARFEAACGMDLINAELDEDDL